MWKVLSRASRESTWVSMRKLRGCCLELKIIKWRTSWHWPQWWRITLSSITRKKEKKKIMLTIDVKGVNSTRSMRGTCYGWRLRDKLINCTTTTTRTTRTYSNSDRRLVCATVCSMRAYKPCKCSIVKDKSQSRCWCHCLRKNISFSFSISLPLYLLCAVKILFAPWERFIFFLVSHFLTSQILRCICDY